MSICHRYGYKKKKKKKIPKEKKKKDTSLGSLAAFPHYEIMSLILEANIISNLYK